MPSRVCFLRAGAILALPVLMAAWGPAPALAQDKTDAEQSFEDFLKSKTGKDEDAKPQKAPPPDARGPNNPFGGTTDPNATPGATSDPDAVRIIDGGVGTVTVEVPPEVRRESEAHLTKRMDEQMAALTGKVDKMDMPDRLVFVPSAAGRRDPVVRDWEEKRWKEMVDKLRGASFQPGNMASLEARLRAVQGMIEAGDGAFAGAGVKTGIGTGKGGAPGQAQDAPGAQGGATGRIASATGTPKGTAQNAGTASAGASGTKQTASRSTGGTAQQAGASGSNSTGTAHQADAPGNNSIGKTQMAGTPGSSSIGTAQQAANPGSSPSGAAQQAGRPGSRPSGTAQQVGAPGSGPAGTAQTLGGTAAGSGGSGQQMAAASPSQGTAPSPGSGSVAAPGSGSAQAGSISGQSAGVQGSAGSAPPATGGAMSAFERMIRDSGTLDRVDGNKGQRGGQTSTQVAATGPGQASSPGSQGAQGQTQRAGGAGSQSGTGQSGSGQSGSGQSGSGQSGTAKTGSSWGGTGQAGGTQVAKAGSQGGPAGSSAATAGGTRVAAGTGQAGGAQGGSAASGTSGGSTAGVSSGAASAASGQAAGSGSSGVSSGTAKSGTQVAAAPSAGAARRSGKAASGAGKQGAGKSTAAGPAIRGKASAGSPSGGARASGSSSGGAGGAQQMAALSSPTGSPASGSQGASGASSSGASGSSGRSGGNAALQRLLARANASTGSGTSQSQSFGSSFGLKQELAAARQAAASGGQSGSMFGGSGTSSGSSSGTSSGTSSNPSSGSSFGSSSGMSASASSAASGASSGASGSSGSSGTASPIGVSMAGGGSAGESTAAAPPPPPGDSFAQIHQLARDTQDVVKRVARDDVMQAIEKAAPGKTQVTRTDPVNKPSDAHDRGAVDVVLKDPNATDADYKKLGQHVAKELGPAYGAGFEKVTGDRQADTYFKGDGQRQTDSKKATATGTHLHVQPDYGIGCETAQCQRTYEAADAARKDAAGGTDPSADAGPAEPAPEETEVAALTEGTADTPAGEDRPSADATPPDPASPPPQTLDERLEQRYEEQKDANEAVEAVENASQPKGPTGQDQATAKQFADKSALMSDAEIVAARKKLESLDAQEADLKDSNVFLEKEQEEFRSNARIANTVLPVLKGLANLGNIAAGAYEIATGGAGGSNLLNAGLDAAPEIGKGIAGQEMDKVVLGNAALQAAPGGGTTLGVVQGVAGKATTVYGLAKEGGSGIENGAEGVSQATETALGVGSGTFKTGEAAADSAKVVKELKTMGAWAGGTGRILTGVRGMVRDTRESIEFYEDTVQQDRNMENTMRRNNRRIEQIRTEREYLRNRLRYNECASAGTCNGVSAAAATTPAIPFDAPAPPPAPALETGPR